MKYCSECGEKIGESQKFCSSCGKQVDVKEEKVEKSFSNKLICPHCGSDNVQVQIVSNTKNTGCLTIFIYIVLALTIIGIPIMILIALLKGKKTINNKYYVCQNCGKTFNPLFDFKGLNEKQNAKNIVLAFIVLFILVIFVGVSIGLQDTDYVDFDQYQKLDVQQLHNDYLDNEISANDKYEGNYYYFEGKIYDITEFFGDKYLTIQYISNRNNANKIELNAYFNSSDAFTNIKKGETVTVYCKFKERSIEDYFGITSYSLHSCQFKNN